MATEFDAALDGIERALQDRQPPAAFAALVALLVRGRTVRDRQASPDTADPVAWERSCARFCALYVRLLTDPHWDPLTEPAMPAFLFELTGLYGLIGNGDPTALQSAIERQAARFNATRQPADFLRLLLLWTPSSPAFDPFRHVEGARAVVVAQALATLGMIVCADPQAHAARRAAVTLFNSGRVTADDVAPFVNQPVFAAAWMRTSYHDAPDRHDVKRLLNAATSRVLADTRPVQPAAVVAALPAPSLRPRVVVPLEQAFVEGGAMFRCYAPLLRHLRTRCELVGLGEQAGSDRSTRELFDQFLTYEELSVPGAAPVAATAAAIRALQPALLFYPSIGMRLLVILLANQRLAPVQVMSVGHPASSRSPCIDAVLAEAPWVPDAALFSERLLAVPQGTFVFEAPAAGLSAAPAADGALHVAVPAVLHKVGWPFLECLAAAQRLAARPLVFHFFGGLAGAVHAEGARRIARALPGAQVYPFMAYGDYLARVAGCHLHAASFPFGGTNSLIDSLRLGIPVLALEGREIHERIDADFVRRLGLDDVLVVEDADAYARSLARLADQPDSLAGLRERVRTAVAGSALLHRGGEPQHFTAALCALLEAST